MPKIYIIEDDESIREFVIYALNSHGFEARGFESGEEFSAAIEKSLPHLVLIDIMLPGKDGLKILKELRKDGRTNGIPAIMLTAKGGEYDKVMGLDAGADDYVTKPFSVLELISRINAVLRRKPAESSSTLAYGNISLDAERHTVKCGNEYIQLTFKEFELLQYLLQNTDIVLSRDKILERVWGFDFEGESRTVDMHVKTLRQKLGGGAVHIKTVRGVGYKIGD